MLDDIHAHIYIYIYITQNFSAKLTFLLSPKLFNLYCFEAFEAGLTVI